MSNKIKKNEDKQETKEEKILEEEIQEETEEVEQEEEKKEETKPVPEEKLPPLTKKERWFARNADKLDDAADKVIKVGKWVLGGALLLTAGALIHKGLHDDDPVTIDVEAKVSDPEPEETEEFQKTTQDLGA